MEKMKKFVSSLRHVPTEHPLLLNSAKFFLLTIISVCITIVHSQKQDAWFLLIKEPLVGFFSGLPYFLLLFSPIGLVFLSDFWQYWANSDVERIPNAGLQAVLRAFNEIVNVKLKRFKQAVQAHNTPLCLEATKPEEQIKTILMHLHNTLRFLTNNEELKIVLAEVKDNKLSGTYYTAPAGHDPGFLKQDLNNDTFFDLVLRENKFQCHENLEKLFESNKKKKYYKFKNGLIDKGSIVGFPVLDTNLHICYVLTIKSDDTDLKKTFNQKYKGILEMFYKRLLLESTLISIRDKYHECSIT